MSLLSQYSEEEFKNIVKNSYSWRELYKNLGYNCNSGDLKNQIQKKVEELHIDVSHFGILGKNKIKRDENNVFIKNSTANQSTLRRWYLKSNYTEYKCSICEQEPFWNGKELTLILDHINGINNDDRKENLRWVCPNCNSQLSTTGGRNIKKESIKKYYCRDCGKEISYNSSRCIDCFSKSKIIPYEDMKVDRDTLKDKIRNISFVKLAEEYNVSDNAVRKWCKKYNIPYKRKDILRYTEEEWKNI